MAATIIVRITDLACFCCARDLEARLRSDSRIAAASVDYRAGTATLTARGGELSEEEAKTIVHEAGYCCDGERPSMEHLAHRVATAPITMGTTQDRMQYEMEARHHGHHGHVARGRAATAERPAEAAHDHTAHTGHDAVTVIEPVHDHSAHVAADHARGARRPCRSCGAGDG